MNLQTILIYIAIPLIGAGIGWLTNRIAIRMLFHPREPMGLGRIKIQGLIPRRKNELANIVAQAIGEHLLSQEDINKALKKLKLGPYFISMVDELIEKELAYETMGKGKFSVKITEMIYRGIQKEIHKRLPNHVSEINPELINDLIKEIDIEGHIEEKIASFEIDKFEKLVKKISHRELFYIEILGGFIGFLLGLLQVGFILLTK